MNCAQLASVACAKASPTGSQAGVLRDDDRVEGRHVIADQVVEIVARAAAAQPFPRAEPVGAERDDEPPAIASAQTC